MKKHVIFTASDAKYGDFLIDHWYASLRENVDLRDLDVVVLDYGLSTAQRYYLTGQGVAVHPGRRDGHVVMLRFRDMAGYLQSHPYEQAVLSDSGDIIFQADFSRAFAIHPEKFRGVAEDLRPAFGVFLTEEYFTPEDRRRIRKSLRDVPMVNAGFILGPAARMRALGEEVYRVILDKDHFGPDQLVVNDIFLREGCHLLERTYNFVVATSKVNLEIHAGTFYADGELMAVVHNSGNLKFLRPIENFGYGPDRNELKKEVYFALQALHGTTDSVMETRTELRRVVSTMKDEISRGTQHTLDQLEGNWEGFKRLFLHDDKKD
jgi:hypothetical protein